MWMVRELVSGSLTVVLLGCGHPSEPPKPPKPPATPDKVAEEDHPVVVTSPPGEDLPLRKIDRTVDVQPSRGHWEKTTFVCDGKAKAASASLLGIGAPREPSRSALSFHVRRKPATAARGAALNLDLARAMDAATYDTSYCATLTDAARDVVLVLSVRGGRVASVAAEDGTTPPSCLLDRACELSVPTLAGVEKVAVGLVVRRLTDTPATIAVTDRRLGTRDPESPRDVDALKTVFAEAATGCEQGELLGPKPVSVVFLVSASMHSTVQPTVNLSPVATSKPPPPNALVQCVIDRLEGYRLPMSPWHDIGVQNVHVSWGG